MFKRLTRNVRAYPIPFLFFGSAIVTWPFLAELDAFERFHKFSRAHEEWDLDELALLIVNLSLALLASVIFQWSKVDRLARERDVQRKRAERYAFRDPLTGLMNRRAFVRRLGETSRNAKTGEARVLAMVDLDRFKPVNDLHGHAAGDATLRVVAERLLECFDADCCVARLGGDEFAVAFHCSISPEAAERRARQFLLEMERPVNFEGAEIFVNASVGMVHWHCDEPPGEAVRQADKALYSAKTEQRSHFNWYDAELDQRSQERNAIEADLRLAIQNEEIEPWFQPIIQIGTNRLVGFEVLARWTHPTRGPISPGVFISIAEDCALIGKLGMMLLRRSCRIASSWDPALSISFNLSSYQFHDPRLIQNVRKILEECAFDASRLIIEVTESAVIRDFGLARTQLDALKDLGVGLALDDFGTGYSSLASLQKLPFDRIKIDRSFVTGIAEERQNQRIVSGIMALASGLELGVTAEGIETLNDLQFLQELECQLGQGFLFDRAVPAETVDWMLETAWRDFSVEPGQSVEAEMPKDTKSA